MRTTRLAPGEYYHVFGRGIAKQNIYKDARDYARFLFYLLYGQSLHSVQNVARHVSTFAATRDFGVSLKTANKILEDRLIELCAFTLMPNHFHLLLLELEEGGISNYMHRVLMGYARSFNEKYGASGHVFQGPFQAVHIEDNVQLLHVSAYIHKNQDELRSWKGKGDTYPWSSYHDYVLDNRWGELLQREHILEQFSSSDEYKQFVLTSTAKESEL